MRAILVWVALAATACEQDLPPAPDAVPIDDASTFGCQPDCYRDAGLVCSPSCYDGGP